jgi:hypothetical protein
MSLTLGKQFNRNYNIRIPFLDGFYNIGIFFDKRSTFLLFSVKPDFSSSSFEKNIKVNMFKNLESSKFCETFLDLHNYRKSTLDISNQFEKVKPEYSGDLSFVFNETLTLAKVELHDKSVYDLLNIYGFTINSYLNEFVFILTERHNIVKRLGKKIVRTSGLQIATTPALTTLDDYHGESREQRISMEVRYPSDKIIKLDEED